MLQSLIRNFLRGLLVVAPAAATLWVVWMVFVTVDGWLALERFFGYKVPGAGLVVTLALITLAGFLAGNIATRWLFGATERLFSRLPLVKILYTSLRDLIDAFVGEKKRFDRPVLVSVGDGSDLAVIGFLTREDLAPLGLAGRVAVYFPQSYNFAGNLLVVPRERVRPLPLEATAAMTFIVSGGVSGQLGPPRPEAPAAPGAGTKPS